MVVGKLKTVVGIKDKIMKKNIALVKMMKLKLKKIVLNVVMKKHHINVIDMVM
jgi:hypothetical protein